MQMRQGRGSAAWTFWMLVLVVACAVLARLAAIGEEPLWLDEAYSLWFAQRDWTYLWAEVPRFETHPPLYYSLLKLWIEAFGQDEVVLRLPSLAFSAGLVVLAAILARLVVPEHARRRAMALAAVLAAVSWVQTRYAIEARPYAAFSFAVALALCGFAWLVRHPGGATSPPEVVLRRPAAVLAHAAVALGLAMMLWFHNVGTVYAASFAAFWLAWWAAALRFSRHAFGNMAVTGLFALALWSPFLEPFLHQVGGVREGFWLQPPGIAGTVSEMNKVFGPLHGVTPLSLAVNALLGVAGIAGVILLRRRGGLFAGLLPLVVAFLPPLVLLVATYAARPVFMERVLVPSALPWLVLLAAAVALVPAARPRNLLAVAVVGIYGLGAVLHFLAFEKEPWDRIAALIGDESRPGDVVVVLPNSLAHPYGYYAARMDLDVPLRPAPAPYPVGPEHFRPTGGGTAGIGNPATAEAFVDDVSGDRVWYVTRMSDLFDPHGLLARALERRFGPGEKVMEAELISVFLYPGALQGHARAE